VDWVFALVIGPDFVTYQPRRTRAIEVTTHPPVDQIWQAGDNECDTVFSRDAVG